MRKRLLYGAGIVLLGILVTLVVWQVSFNRGEYGPRDLSQALIFWAVSTLVFVLTVTLGFILFRTAVKLYVERRSNREGSRIKTKLFFGALALSFMPVCFLVFFSYALLNRSLDKWFGLPAEKVQIDYVRIANTLKSQLEERLEVQAALLSERPELQTSPSTLANFCAGQRLSAAELRLETERQPTLICGDSRTLSGDSKEYAVIRHPVETRAGRGLLVLSARIPLDVAATEQQIATYVGRIDEQKSQQKYFRWFYIMMQSLIALFTLFVSTWIALFLAKQISVPISALLRAADEVGEGNLNYRVEVGAIDELAGLVHGFNEMTRQLEANRAELDARRRFTEAILESIPTGVISISFDGTIRRVNRALKGILSDAATRARRLEDLFSREDTAELKYMMKRARRTGATSREMELKAEGKTLHLAVTVSAIEEKISPGFVIVLEDLSDLLRAQKAAAWHEVARRVAHEIKNPLTPIALSAERIGRQLERLQLPAEVRRIVTECTVTISKEVESVKTLVNEFSQFARFPAAQLVRSDLNEVVAEASAVFQGRLDGIRIHTGYTAGLPPVNLDREQFKRVVVNLVDNAAEAMQDSLVKQLYISTQSGTAETVELIVADTGCGISPEDKERLFLPYFSTKGRGTGLGLAIVNHILSDHNAAIRVEDNRPVGARFTVELPAVVEMADETRSGDTAAVVRS